MPYASGQFPSSWKNLPGGVRAEAVKILNALLKDGMDESKAIPIALSRAREYVKNHAEEDGVWRTVNGRKIFIAKGEDAKTAMEKSLTGDRAQTKEAHRRAMSYHANMAKRAAQQGDKKTAAAHERAIGAHADAVDKGDKSSSIKANLESDRAHNPKEYAMAMMTKMEMMAKCKKDHPDWTPTQHEAWVEKEMAKSSEYTNVVRGIEIFAAGTHNGDTYTEADLDEMVAAHTALDFRPAIKIGHTKDTTGAPAYGWVQNLRRVGQKLVADFTDMHDSVVEALRKRSYDRVSSEVYFNLNRGGKQFRRALKAVALLGAEVPAVAGLTPLHKMEFAADGEYEKFTAHEDALYVSPQAVFDCLSERMSVLIQQFSSEDITMKTAKQLQDELKTLTERLDAIGEGDLSDKDKDAEVKKLSADIAAVTSEIKLLTQHDADEREELTCKNKANEERIAQLEADARRRGVAEKVATVRVPAFRAGLEAMYAYALTHAAEKVRVYAKDDKGTETSAEKTLVEIADSFVTQINAQADKLFKTFASVGIVQREDGSTEDPNEPANITIDRKAREYIAKHPELKGDYLAALTAAKAEDPDLARRYTEEASARASAH
ncbi:MAG: hypothetical protein U1A72_01965 [Sulfuritalea sp.]|nr:hypothetical protein [Sulfuritalea sp.]